MLLLSVEELESYRPIIRRVCFHTLGDSWEAEDATQDTFVRVISHMDQYRGDASPGTWLCHIALSVCLNHIKKESHSRNLASLDAPDLAELVDPGHDPLVEIEREVYLRQLLCAIHSEARSRIPPWDGHDYHVFKACFRGERKSWPQVGCLLSMNPETAKYHYYNHILPTLKSLGTKFPKAVTESDPAQSECGGSIENCLLVSGLNHP